ncbi:MULTISPECIES: hypothetical protein [Bosea]|uniref:Entry exclusion lipoprotein TrbK n=1 Tax=Bosea rubneri TaxID=3075434 RepID=A0ABU3SAH4_9HYPH|nr:MULTISPECIES: hypothetical protein [unclassified Bosea (in: a-proteobacteria)]MDU0341791.1 hypothetical protein [Bosea sp. ZW T0_25]
MTSIRMIGLVFLTGIVLSGCQTSQSRQEELAAICANPVNRQPQNFYFDECQALYPSSDRALQKDYRLGAPAGR